MAVVTEELTADDLHAALRLVGALHEAADVDDLAHRLVDGLAVAVGADVVSYNDIDLLGHMTRTVFEPELADRADIERAFDALQHEHPLIADYAATGDLRVRRLSDHIRLPDLHALDLWREVFRPLETNHQLALAVIAVPGRVIGIGLNRWRRDFTDRELAFAQIVQEHLPGAYDHARLRASAAPDARGLHALSGRELEVLRLVADGRTNREIGRILFIEPRTVEKHVEHIRTKLGARSRAEAAAMFARREPALRPEPAIRAEPALH